MAIKASLSGNLEALLALTNPDHTMAPDSRRKIDWPAIVDLARRHRVEGVVAQRVRDWGDQVPDAIRSHFDACRRGHAIAALQACAGLKDIGDAFESRGVAYIVMKGLAISERFYGSRAERQSIDIDILVDESEIDPAVEALLKLGFEYEEAPNIPAYCESLVRYVRKDVKLVRARDGLAVELHWRLGRNQYLLPWQFSDALRLSEHLTIAGAQHRVFKPSALLVYLACHGSMHKWFRLKWLTDIQRLVSAMPAKEFDEACEIARRAGCLRILATTIDLAERLYGCRPPSQAADLAAHTAPKLTQEIYRALENPVVPHDGAPLSLRDYVAQLRYEFGLKADGAFRMAALRSRLISFDDVNYLRLSERWYYLYLVAGPFIGAFRAITRSGRGERA